MPDLGSDVYDRGAEFHELFMDEPWSRLRPLVRAALAGVAADGVIVELGAGSGVGTQVIIEETAGRVIALEPHLVMRSMLTGRVASRPELARRVTIHAGSVPVDLGLLPEQVDAVVCTHLLGHLCLADRRSLYAWLGSHLSATGVGLLTAAPTDAGSDPAGEVAEITSVRRIGDHEYRAVHVDSGPATYRTRYEVIDHGVVIRSQETSGVWLSVTVTEMTEDLNAVGLAVEQVADGVLSVSRGSAPFE